MLTDGPPGVDPQDTVPLGLAEDLDLDPKASPLGSRGPGETQVEDTAAATDEVVSREASEPEGGADLPGQRPQSDRNRMCRRQRQRAAAMRRAKGHQHPHRVSQA